MANRNFGTDMRSENKNKAESYYSNSMESDKFDQFKI